MSKRAGTFIALDDLLAELGADAARWYFASRGANVNMDVDIELAKRQSSENPVYYVQYAHARIASILRKAADAVYPGLPIIPSMETGATDGRQLRTAGIPTYGVSGMFLDEDDNREHGRDERVGVQDYYDALAFNYQLVRALAY